MCNGRVIVGLLLINRWDGWMVLLIVAESDIGCR
jgi:hypothetical protein